MQEMQVRSLGQEDPLEEEVATHSSILAWGILLIGQAWQAIVHDIAKELEMTGQLNHKPYLKPL